ncbi:hypothetical protein C8F04DRAFT_1264927 [Mycena alexandri]|uniref:Uncharacterized protein n=1 Tax=Mycena alexandri TaxID=1745969 RepID=A0AAD6SM54_9AGAR|nr:hypothetical protein C8F04DRAFT_1264927 [Mycena alexandri]
MSPKRKQPTGQLHIHQPHIASMVGVSTDGRRAVVVSNVVDTSQPRVSQWAGEDVAAAETIEGGDFRESFP